MTKIPEFDQNGNLPPGIYKPTWEEIRARFIGKNNLVRESRTASLKEFIGFISTFADSIWINGSYITQKPAPGDVDVAVVLPKDFDFDSKESKDLERYKDQKDTLHLDIFYFEMGPQSEALKKWIDGWTKDRDYNDKGIIFLELNK